MPRKNETQKMVEAQLAEYGIEFGARYRDSASLFEGTVTSVHFYQHGCMRVTLRGASKTTGEPLDCSFDAPELVSVATEVPVPKGTTRGGPHGLSSPSRTGVTG